MNPKISELNEKLQPYRNEIVKHKLYSKLKTKSDIKKLMESHVFAVWDFMSLLKALQINLTCFEIPWRRESSGIAVHDRAFQCFAAKWDMDHQKELNSISITSAEEWGC